MKFKIDNNRFAKDFHIGVSFNSPTVITQGGIKREYYILLQLGFIDLIAGRIY